MTDREKRIYLLGYNDGVGDQNHGSIQIISDKFGDLYKTGYIKGYDDAVNKKYYICSLNSDGNVIKSWYVDNAPEINGWTKVKNEAAAYKTRSTAENKCNEIKSSCGRGNYTVIWC